MQNDFLPQDETVYANTQLYEIYAEPSPEPQKRSKKKLRWGRIFCFALLLAAVLAVFSLLRGEETVADLSTLPPQDICIVLDAGHGGRDNGSSAEGVLEKDLNLQMILQLGENLKKKGYKVLFTRETDRFIELEERAAVANRQKAHLFISLHCNSFTNETANGTEVYYNAENGAELLAAAIYDSLLHKLGTKGRNHSFGRYTVLSHTNMPGVLIEVGFLSNAGERAKLCDKDFQADAAAAIAEGIESFIYGKAD